MKVVLFIHPGGRVTAVYSDAVLKMGLGKARIRRATRVEFNARRRRWEATLPSGRLLCHAITRALCLRREKAAVLRQMDEKYGYTKA